MKIILAIIKNTIRPKIHLIILLVSSINELIDSAEVFNLLIAKNGNNSILCYLPKVSLIQDYEKYQDMSICFSKHKDGYLRYKCNSCQWTGTKLINYKCPHLQATISAYINYRFV